MKYYIDGYNLIGKTDSISLSDPEKEQALIILLQHLFPNPRHKFFIIFDGHHPFLFYGSNQKLGRFSIKFTPNDQSADDYLIDNIIRRTKNKTGLIIVSSDNRILTAARQNRITSIKSEDFLKTATPENTPRIKNDTKISDREIEYWLQIFKEADS